MITKIEKVFRSPYAVPNGLQVTDDGLWIVDQITDRVALVEVTSDPDYIVPKLIRDIPSESSNTSGMTYGDGALWLAANGSGERWRPVRDTDAETGEVFKVDPDTGETLERYPIPNAAAHTALNMTITMADISGSKPSRIRSHIRSGFPTGLSKRRCPYHMDVDTAWFALKTGFGQPIPLIGSSSSSILKTAHRLM